MRLFNICGSISDRSLLWATQNSLWRNTRANNKRYSLSYTCKEGTLFTLIHVQIINRIHSTTRSPDTFSKPFPYLVFKISLHLITNAQEAICLHLNYPTFNITPQEA
jgi:hypothetical protein